MTVTAPLHRVTPARDQAATWGVCWPRGTVLPGASFTLDADGAPHPVQSWPLATWPDGSWKWTGHSSPGLPAGALVVTAHPAASRPVTSPPVAAPPVGAPTAAGQASPDPADGDGPGAADGDVPGAAEGDAPGPADGHTPGAADGADALRVTASGDGWIVADATRAWHVAPGRHLIDRVEVDGRLVGRDVALVSLWQDGPDDDGARPAREDWSGRVESVVVEQDGPTRAVLLLTGAHHPDGVTARGSDAWLPFRVRLIFGAGRPDVLVQHTFVWDGDAATDFLAGLGVRVQVPLRAEPWNRHVRLSGPIEDGRVGFLSEAALGITGLRRDPGAERRAAQVAGRPLDDPSGWPATVGDRLRWIPVWNDWSLAQLSPDGFTLRKRTGPGHAWVPIPGSTRSSGFSYAGDTVGGVALGRRSFWQTHPVGVDIRGMGGDAASLTSWLWSPEAPAMDLRFYHDGLGQDTSADQLDALEITYEDHEPGFGDPHGIARTAELRLFAHAGTPTPEALAADALATEDPVVVMPTPAHLAACGVFGDWLPIDPADAAVSELEALLDGLFAFYAGQVEDRRWYGFWDFGDVMHAYDPDRHQWRYDVGGYAWDNSELSTDLWLWLQLLRTGRADVFRMAEAMSRHTGEVDVHHAGRFAGLGSRHNVQHFGCSAKQLRISSAVYRRIHYYLTADERVGDLLAELVDAERTFLALDPTRKVRHDGYVMDPHAVSVGLGTDWSALASAWLTGWERVGDDAVRARCRDKLLGTMADIGALPQGFLSGEARLDLATGRFDTAPDQRSVSHLSAVFGLVEVCAEVIDLTAGTPHEQPGFAQAWARYCRYYLTRDDDPRAATAADGVPLAQAHSRLAAWAGTHDADPALADLAWSAFLSPRDSIPHDRLRPGRPLGIRVEDGPTVLAPVREAPGVSTNGAAQFALAAIQNLALARAALPGDADA